MAGEPELHYFNGRGRMESIGWLLAAAGVERHKSDVPASTNGGHRRNDTGADQTRTILNYMAPKYNLYRRDLKERALIDMYTEGMADLNEMIIVLPLCPPDQKDAKIALIKERTTDCYLPMFEKVLKSHGQDYLVGNMLSRADIHLVELLYYVEELDPSLLANFPLLKNQQSPHHEEVSVAWQPEEASH